MASAELIAAIAPPLSSSRPAARGKVRANRLGDGHRTAVSPEWKLFRRGLCTPFSDRVLPSSPHWGAFVYRLSHVFDRRGPRWWEIIRTRYRPPQAGATNSPMTSPRSCDLVGDRAILCRRRGLTRMLGNRSFSATADRLVPSRSANRELRAEAFDRRHCQHPPPCPVPEFARMCAWNPAPSSPLRDIRSVPPLNDKAIPMWPGRAGDG